MSSIKQRTKFGLLAKVEAVYGTAETLAAATDGVQLISLPEPNMDEYLYDGSRGLAPGSGGKLPMSPPSGLGFSSSFEMHPVGGGAAYSASVVPPGVHTLLCSSGLEATGAFGAGTETWTYAPESGPTGFDSITVEAYVNGQKYPGKGCYSTFGIAIEGPGIPTWTFETQGIGTAAPTDAAVPSITYPVTTRIPPKATAITFVLGTGTPFSTNAKVRGFNFSMNREMSPRADDNSAGAHAGFTPGRRAPTFEITIEQVNLATVDPWYTATTLNPYKLKEEMDIVGITLQVGSVQYNRYKINLPQCQLMTVEDGEDGSTSTWTLTFACVLSGAASDNDFSIVFD